MTDELAARLARHGIDVARFGTGTAKSLDQLRAELAAGEAVLVEREGRLVRRLLGVLNIDVLYDGPDGRRRLVEDRQEFAGGHIRQRPLPASVSEKLKPGENLPDAAARALAEELGVRKFKIISPFRENFTTKESPAYGLLTEYPIHAVEVLPDPGEFRPEYREVQPDKTTFFRWEAIA